MSDETVVRRRARPLLGTFVEVEARGATLEEIDRAIDLAFSAVARVHAAMSVHDSGSELSVVNREAHLGGVRVSPWTLEVARASLALAQESAGAFDPTVGRHLVRQRYLPRPLRARRYGAASFRDVCIVPEPDGGGRIAFARPLVFDLGGIAKGFAVDRAIEELRRCGCLAGLVNAGGDLAHFGDQPVRIELRSALDPRRLDTTVWLRDEALATSAPYFTRRRRRGAQLSHLFEPATGEPLSDGASATVIAPSCMVADALTKVALFAPQRFPQVAGRYGARAAGGNLRGAATFPTRRLKVAP